MKIDFILKIRVFITHVHFFDKYYLENLKISYMCHLGNVMVSFSVMEKTGQIPLKLVVFYDNFKNLLLS